MKPSEIFREARVVLFERGWHQGSTSGDDGSVCLYHALAIASHNSCISLKPWLRQATGSRWPSHWNDEPETTFDDVIDALDQAEKLAMIAEESA